MNKKILLIVLTVLAVSSATMADIIYFDDGRYHTIDANTPRYDSLLLDSKVANNPGTHVNLVDGGWIWVDLWAQNNSKVTMSGGLIGRTIFANGNSTINMSGGSVKWGIGAFNNTTVNMSGGSVGWGITAFNNTTVTMTGGTVDWALKAIDNATVTMSGGAVGEFAARDNATISLHGTYFEIDGTPLVYGDRLSNFGMLVENGNEDYYTGTITGILADGTALNDTFRIYNTGEYAGTADIIIIPEPCSLTLLGLGIFALRKRRA